MDLGDRVYYLDIIKHEGKLTGKELKQGTLVGLDVSHTGYGMARILPDKGTPKLIELAHVHSDIKDCEDHIARVSEHIDKGEQVASDAVSAIDKIRLKVIGEPMYTDLANKITGKA